MYKILHLSTLLVVIECPHIAKNCNAIVKSKGNGPILFYDKDSASRYLNLAKYCRYDEDGIFTYIETYNNKNPINIYEFEIIEDV